MVAPVNEAPPAPQIPPNMNVHTNDVQVLPNFNNDVNVNYPSLEEPDQGTNYPAQNTNQQPQGNPSVENQNYPSQGGQINTNYPDNSQGINQPLINNN